MGKVTYSPGIEYVNGALAKAKKKDGHRCCTSVRALRTSVQPR